MRAYQLRQHAFLEAAEVRIHHVERHLHRVKLKTVFTRDFEHVKMNARIFMTSETDETNLTGVARLYERGVGPLLVEDAMRIFVTKNLVVLDQIDVIGLHSLQRLLELFCRSFLRATVNLCHQEHSLPVSVA